MMMIVVVITFIYSPPFSMALKADYKYDKKNYAVNQQANFKVC